MQIRYQPTRAIIAEGPLGWGITPFEGNYYIRRRYLRDGSFRPDFIPGVCVYKGLYIGLNYTMPDGVAINHLGWMYWLPSPLFPFIMFRVAIPAEHLLLMVESIDQQAACLHDEATQVPTSVHCVQPGSIPTEGVTRHAP